MTRQLRTMSHVLRPLLVQVNPTFLSVALPLEEPWEGCEKKRIARRASRSIVGGCARWVLYYVNTSHVFFDKFTYGAVDYSNLSSRVRPHGPAFV